jgi:hypothetical protein
MKQMPGVVEGKAVLFVRTAEATDLLLPLIETIGKSGKMIGSTETG